MKKQESIIPSKLIISVEKFREKIEEIIQNGENLSKENDKNKIEEDYESWNDSTQEFIRRSFDKANNEYHEEYSYKYESVFYIRPTFEELQNVNQLQKIKNNFNEKIKRLKKIKNKIQYMDMNATTESNNNKSVYNGPVNINNGIVYGDNSQHIINNNDDVINLLNSIISYIPKEQHTDKEIIQELIKSIQEKNPIKKSNFEKFKSIISSVSKLSIFIPYIDPIFHQIKNLIKLT